MASVVSTMWLPSQEGFLCVSPYKRVARVEALAAAATAPLRAEMWVCVHWRDLVDGDGAVVKLVELSVAGFVDVGACGGFNLEMATKKVM